MSRHIIPNAPGTPASRRTIDRLLDNAAWLGVIVAVEGGWWAATRPGSWALFAVGAVIFALVEVSMSRLKSYRDQRDKLHAVAVELVRDMDALTGGDLRRDAMDYVPVDVLAEARTEVPDV